MLSGHSSYFATYESNSYNSPRSPDRALTSVFHPTHHGRARLSSNEASSSLPAASPYHENLFVRLRKIYPRTYETHELFSFLIIVDLHKRSSPVSTLVSPSLPFFLSDTSISPLFPSLSPALSPPLSLSLSFCSTYCSGLLSHLQAPLSRSRIVNSLSYSLSLLSLTGSAPFYSASHRVARVRLLFVVHLMYAFLRARANVYTKGRSSLAISARAPTA